MKIDMKQRIIGVVVIIALAIILIPLFVSQHQHDEIIKQAQISSQPENPSVNSANQLQALNNQITEQAQDKVDWQGLQPASAAQPGSSQDATANTQPNTVAVATHLAPSTEQAAQPGPMGVQPSPTVPDAAAPSVQMQMPAPATTTQANAIPASTASVEQPAAAIPSTELTTASMPPPAEAVVAKTEATKPTQKQPEIKLLDKTNVAKSSKSSSANTFLVQLGNFSSKKNASVLKTRLEKHGFHSVIEENKGHFRVLVGPATSHDKAAKRLQAISQKLNVSGFLVKG